MTADNAQWLLALLTVLTGVYTLASSTRKSTFESMERIVATLQGQVDLLQSEIKDMKSEIKLRDETIAQRDETIAQRDAVIEELKAWIEEIFTRFPEAKKIPRKVKI